MAQSDNMYWERWEKLLEAAANFQGLFPGSIMIGGSAAAIHLGQRYSFDVDHILSDLKDKYEEVLAFLEGRDDWETARIHPPKLVLGSFQGVETGIRQLRRNFPLETEVIEAHGKKITLPTIPEMARTKAWMLISRNTTRDYIDFLALSNHMGLERTVDVLKDFNLYYSDLIMGQKASPLVQLVRQLAEPRPADLDHIDLSQYKGLRTPYDSWENIEHHCGEISVALADLLCNDVE